MTSTPHQATPVHIDTAAVATLVDGRWADYRRQTRDLLLDPDLRKQEGLSLTDYRERVLAQAKKLVEMGVVQRAFPERLGGSDDPGGNLAGFEEMAIADPSLQIKGGVQWGLFGAAILHLGTEAHHDELLPGAMDLTVPGCFAMTEIGHGSDVAAEGITET